MRRQGKETSHNTLVERTTTQQVNQTPSRCRSQPNVKWYPVGPSGEAVGWQVSLHRSCHPLKLRKIPPPNPLSSNAHRASTGGHATHDTQSRRCESRRTAGAKLARPITNGHFRTALVRRPHPKPSRNPSFFHKPTHLVEKCLTVSVRGKISKKSTKSESAPIPKLKPHVAI